MSDNQFGKSSDLIFAKLKFFHSTCHIFHSVCQIIILLTFFAHKLKVIAEQVGFITILLLPIIINIYKKLKKDSIEYESNKDIIKLGYKYIDENCEIKD